MQDINFFRNKIICGHVLDVLKDIPDSSIDMVITSPPYWSFRNYETEPQQFGDWRGQLGLESSPELFIDHLLMVFDSIKRVLKPSGSVYVNLGDTYYGSPSNSKDSNLGNVEALEKVGRIKRPTHGILKSKSLCMIPSRFAWGMIQHGWILRNEICWHKPNHSPESVQDRLTKAHEMIYHFTKEPKYFYDLGAIKEPYAQSSIKRITQKTVMEQTGGVKQDELRGNPDSGNASRCNKMVQSIAIKYDEESGKNPGDVWEIVTQSFHDAHFATFPEELIIRPIKSSCPEQVCPKCGTPRTKITKPSIEIGRTGSDTKYDTATQTSGRLAEKRQAYSAMELENPPPKVVVGYSDCGCGQGFIKGIVLDPFMGSGTTAVVAKNLNRDYIGIELNQSYIDIANKRIFENEVKHCRDSDCNKIKAITNVEDA